MTDIDSVNHVGMAVRDLADTVARYEAMGFVLTPYSPHSAAFKPGEPVVPQGSGNRCVMFAQNYLEILANEDPRKPNARMSGFLKHHQGGHIICFNTEAPDKVEARLKLAGIETTGVIPLQREIDTPEGVKTAKFERIQFAPRSSPEGYVQAAKHLTPAYIYQPRYIGHPNGCSSLSNVYLVVLDVTGFAKRYALYTGIRSEVENGSEVFSFAAGGSLTIVGADRAGQFLPETLLPPLPGIAAVAFACPDLAAQRKRLEKAGIHFAESNGRLIVPAELASGIAVVFEVPA